MIIQKKKSIRNILVIVFIVLLITLIICLASMNRLKESEHDELVLTDPVYINEEDGKIYPENSYQLVYTYTGNQKLTTDFYKDIYKFEKYLHHIHEKVNNLNESQIEEYFNINAYTIKNFTGITKLEDFKKIIKNTNIFSDGSAEFKKSVFNIDEKQVTEDYTICPITFEYTNGSKLQFNLYIANHYSADIVLMFMPQ